MNNYKQKYLKYKKKYLALKGGSGENNNINKQSKITRLYNSDNIQSYITQNYPNKEHLDEPNLIHSKDNLYNFVMDKLKGINLDEITEDKLKEIIDTFKPPQTP